MSRAGQSTLGTFASSAETTKSTWIDSQILLVFALEFRHEVGDHSVVEIFASQMSIPCGRLDLENSILNSQDRDIEGTAT